MRLRFVNPQTGKARWEPVSMSLWLLPLVALLPLLPTHGAYIGPSWWLATLLVVMAFLPIFMFSTNSWKRKTLKVSMNKDTFTSVYREEWGNQVFGSGQRTMPWSNLECVRFQPGEEMSDSVTIIMGRANCLVFEWRPSPTLLSTYLSNTTWVSLDDLSDDQRDALFISLAKYVPQELLAPEVCYLQMKALSGDGDKSLTNFTKIWTDEFNRHFEIANYIPLAPGDKCGNGRFTIALTVAARMNSSTYLASTAAGEKVVIKELVAPIDSDDALQSKLIEQFNREASLLATLDHPKIVAVRDHFIENGRSYIVMDRALGKNMREHVRLQGRLDEKSTIAIARQLVEVLHYLHSHQPVILHRDFTPDNFIYGSDGAVTVVDFGAANVFNSGKTATLIGKQNYMPPEQLRGKPSPASDIYTFGASLAFMLTGKDLPSMGKLPSFEDVSISPELLTLMQNCVAFDDQARPTSFDLIASLQQLAPNLETAAT